MNVPGASRIWVAIAAVALFSPPHLVSGKTNSLSIALPLPEIPIARQADDVTGFGGTETSSTPGAPAVPMARYRILLPPDVTPSTVRVTPAEANPTVVPGAWDVLPPLPDVSAPPARRDAPVSREALKDTRLYATDAYFPETCLGRVFRGRIREWRFIDVEVYPVRYNPVKKKLLKADGITLLLTYDRMGKTPTRTAARSMYLRYRAMMKRTSLNFSQFAPLYDELHN